MTASSLPLLLQLSGTDEVIEILLGGFKGQADLLTFILACRRSGTSQNLHIKYDENAQEEEKNC